MAVSIRSITAAALPITAFGELTDYTEPHSVACVGARRPCMGVSTVSAPAAHLLLQAELSRLSRLSRPVLKLFMTSPPACTARVIGKRATAVGCP